MFVEDGSRTEQLVEERGGELERLLPLVGSLCIAATAPEQLHHGSHLLPLKHRDQGDYTGSGGCGPCGAPTPK